MGGTTGGLVAGGVVGGTTGGLVIGSATGEGGGVATHVHQVPLHAVSH